jgi:hypothetical protein
MLTHILFQLIAILLFSSDLVQKNEYQPWIYPHDVFLNWHSAKQRKEKIAQHLKRSGNKVNNNPGTT